VASGQSDGQDGTLDVVVIGAGFAGLYMAYTLRTLGLAFHGFETGSGPGGTWFWNRYPGARCDAESVVYSYSFSEELDQDWTWTERFAAQPEILRYLDHVSDRFDLRRHFSFGTKVVALTFDEVARQWKVETDGGVIVRARFVITAAGIPSGGRMPEIRGMERFVGRVFHTGAGRHEPVNFAGRRVGVVGTGSSGIQLIPQVARDCAHLTVFQRTPNFSVPAQNRPLDAAENARIKQGYRELRQLSRDGLLMAGGASFLTPKDREPAAERAADLSPAEQQAALQKRWDIGGAFVATTFPDIMTDESANAIAAEFVRSKIRSIVRDRQVADRLCPTGYPFASKRICVDTDCHQTYNRPNLGLADIAGDPIAEIHADGVILESGASHVLDDLIFATGFDAITGPLLQMNIRGRGGRPLSAHWENGPRTYLGIGMAGFPNLFTITGPLSPSVLSNVVVSIEQHVEWIRDCLTYMQKNGFVSIEALPENEDEWIDFVAAQADSTLYPRANSWYNGSNIPGKPRRFMVYVGGIGLYRQLCDDISSSGYPGFRFE